MKLFRSKLTIVIIFILCALLQLSFVFSMVFTSTSILQSGTEYKFKLIAGDPFDIFRGKYLFLNYDDRALQYSNAADYRLGDTVYVQYDVGKNGFAFLSSVETKKPSHTKDFLKTFIDSNAGPHIITEEEDVHNSESNDISHDDEVLENSIYIQVPFPYRWYMNENEVQKAEKLYQESEEAYAVIAIKNGKARIKDIYFDTISVSKAIKEIE